MGMAASVDASSIRGVSDLISAHMTQSTTMDVNLANHITNEDWQDEFSSDVEPSPRDIPPPAADVLASPILPKEPTPKHEVASPKQSEEETDHTTEHRETNDSLGADLTGNLVDPAEFASAGNFSVCKTFMSSLLSSFCVVHYFCLLSCAFFRSLKNKNCMNALYDESEWNGLGLRPPRHQRQWGDGQIDDDDTSDDGSLGMGREVENLIKENSELLDMKNALNIVKNDLINQVDELNSENMILRDENLSRQMVSEKMNEQISKLEEELKSMKQRLSDKENEQEEEDVPMAMRKRFTRSEMQRVLMDRNAYKEKLMELEESIKWTEMQRAKKMQQQQQNVNQKKSGGIWEFFSSLLGESVTPPASARGNRSSSTRTGGKMTRSVEYIDPDMIHLSR
uniref:RH2 domain-containing protein n=1 Tax=Caenorhabditis japonica TaxID=281687 RepID=A0A8R1IEL7_CAEJA